MFRCFDPANGLNQLATIAGAATAHDDNGNLTSDPSSARTYVYDAENKMTAAVPSGSTAAYAHYDPLGRLARLTGAAVSDRTLLHDSGTSTLAAEYSSGGAMQRRYVPGDAIDEPLVEYDHSGTRIWLYADERGSVIAGADVAGAGAFINRYDTIPGTQY